MSDAFIFKLSPELYFTEVVFAFLTYCCILNLKTFLFNAAFVAFYYFVFMVVAVGRFWCVFKLKFHYADYTNFVCQLFVFIVTD